MLKRLRLSSYILFILSGLLLRGGLVFSQDSETPSTIESEETVPDEVHETRDLEKLLKSYNKDQEKVLKDATKIHTIPSEETSEISENEIEEMPEAVIEKKPLKKRERIEVDKDAKFSDSVRISLGPLQKLKEEELVKMLNENTKDSTFRPYMEQFPLITIFAVRMIKDKEAIPSLVKITEDKDRLIRFAWWMLGSFIFGFILKKILYNKDHPFLLAFGIFFARFIFMQALRFGIIYYFFKAELTPALDVFKKTFL
jgi:hypothetical protein